MNEMPFFLTHSPRELKHSAIISVRFSGKGMTEEKGGREGGEKEGEAGEKRHVACCHKWVEISFQIPGLCWEGQEALY